MKLFTGNAHPRLACNISDIIAKKLNLNILGKADVFEFSNGETFARIGESIRGKHCFLLQPICYSEVKKRHKWTLKRSSNDNLMELLILMDACRRSSAGSITCVIPYYGYSRTDKKDQAGAPITAKMIASILEHNGADRVITFDLHSSQIQGFFDIPVDNLSASYLFAKTIIKEFSDIQVIVSPDSGGVGRARDLSKRLNWAMQDISKRTGKKFKKTKVAFGDKRRSSNNDNAKITYIIGNVKNKSVLIYDDIVDTAGSLVEIAQVLKKRGAKKVYAACVHGVFSGEAIHRIDNSEIEQLLVTDTIPFTSRNKERGKIKIISIKKILAQAIINVFKKESVTQLFKIDTTNQERK